MERSPYLSPGSMTSTWNNIFSFPKAAPDELSVRPILDLSFVWSANPIGLLLCLHAYIMYRELLLLSYGQRIGKLWVCLFGERMILLLYVICVPQYDLWDILFALCPTNFSVDRRWPTTYPGGWLFEIIWWLQKVFGIRTVSCCTQAGTVILNTIILFYNLSPSVMAISCGKR